MSFFSRASGVNILGGTFYSAALDVNIQNDLQLTIQEDTLLEPPLYDPAAGIAARRTMINPNTPSSSTYSPHPWPPEAATNIQGGTFVGGNVNNIQRNGESGIRILHRAVALAALHDAAESYPQPRCHPETRQALLEDLLMWCTSPSDEPPIL
ncbi:hypothetical protein B0H19DRAFT_1378917 [Mycena capillaripes]|nr:hypothetical protein B0H19DRAFT_1378917 [Mycena capillaripes]